MVANNMNSRKAFEQALKQASPNSLDTVVRVLDKVVDQLFNPNTKSNVSAIRRNLSIAKDISSIIANQIYGLTKDLDEAVGQLQIAGQPFTDSTEVDNIKVKVRNIRETLNYLR